ncbi:hypothetical protein D3C84_736330 [compost metagenome]
MNAEREDRDRILGELAQVMNHERESIACVLDPEGGRIRGQVDRYPDDDSRCDEQNGDQDFAERPVQVHPCERLANHDKADHDIAKAVHPDAVRQHLHDRGYRPQQHDVELAVVHDPAKPPSSFEEQGAETFRQIDHCIHEDDFPERPAVYIRNSVIDDPEKDDAKHLGQDGGDNHDIEIGLIFQNRFQLRAEQAAVQKQRTSRLA